MAMFADQPQPPAQELLTDKLAAFDNVPLFMKSLPEGGDDVAVQALQELAYEGTPDEIAQNFKEQGNEYYQGKRFREAMGFYTQGIDARPTNSKLQESLLCNRAACNLELENYGSVLKDCATAIKLNSKASKAYYRSAAALFALDRLEEALDCLNVLRTFSVEDAKVKGLRERTEQAIDAKERKNKERLDLQKKAEAEARLMAHAFRMRNLIEIRKPGGSANPYSPHFDPEDPSGGTLIIPVFFLYPQYATSDIIPEFIEDSSFATHLDYMFPPQAPPPEWDVKGEYSTKNLVVYATTRQKRLLKVGKKMTLRNVFDTAKNKEGAPKDGLEVRDGCLTFIVLPRGDVEKKWIEEYKSNKEF